MILYKKRITKTLIRDAQAGLSLGLGGKASKNKLKDNNFIFLMTNDTILGVYRTHAQKEYGNFFVNEEHSYP